MKSPLQHPLNYDQQNYNDCDEDTGMNEYRPQAQGAKQQGKAGYNFMRSNKKFHQKNSPKGFNPNSQAKPTPKKVENNLARKKFTANQNTTTNNAGNNGTTGNNQSSYQQKPSEANSTTNQQQESGCIKNNNNTNSGNNSNNNTSSANSSQTKNSWKNLPKKPQNPSNSNQSYSSSYNYNNNFSTYGNNNGGYSNFNNFGYGQQKTGAQKIYMTLTADGVSKLVHMGQQAQSNNNTNGNNNNNSVFELETTNKADKDIIVQQYLGFRILVKYVKDHKNMKARIMISDGHWAVQAIISHEIHNKMETKEIQKYDILKISKCFTKGIDSSSIILVLLSPPVVIYTDIKSTLGNIDELTVTQLNLFTNKASNTSSKPQPVKIPNSVILSHTNIQEFELVFQDGGCMPIAKLAPYMGGRWRIKARLIKKGDRRSWKSDKGEGTLMNVELIDEEGTMIQGTFFQDVADKFCDMLVENKVYLMTGGLIKESRPRFASVKHDFCIVFDKFSEISEIDDDGTVAQEKSKAGFNFVSIDKIAEMNPMESVDIIGIVYMVGPVGTVSLKSGEFKQRRNILICDDTNLTICVCFWGDKASSHDFSGHPVVAVKNAKVSDFASKSLNANEDSAVFFNCQFEKAKEMRAWYDGLSGSDDNFHPLSTGTGLENMMKEPPKDETLHRFCQPSASGLKVNPEEGNTIDQDLEMQEGDENQDTDMIERSISPNEIRKKLFEERRKSFARKWFTKYNYLQKMKEASSGIGEERIVQMELARSMATRARKRGRKPKQQESALGLPQEFKYSSNQNNHNYHNQYNNNYNNNNGGGGHGGSFNGFKKRGRKGKSEGGNNGGGSGFGGGIPGVDPQ